MSEPNFNKFKNLVEISLNDFTDEYEKKANRLVKQKLRNNYLGKVTGELYKSSGVKRIEKTNSLAFYTKGYGLIWDDPEFFGTNITDKMDKAYMRRYKQLKRKYKNRRSNPNWIGRKKRPYLRDTIKEMQRQTWRMYKKVTNKAIRKI